VHCDGMVTHGDALLLNGDACLLCTMQAAGSEREHQYQDTIGMVQQTIKTHARVHAQAKEEHHLQVSGLHLQVITPPSITPRSSSHLCILHLSPSVFCARGWVG